jgi:hypothetical protein
LGKVTDTQPKRAVSLIASATEIVCALGACDLLVGRSHECDFPRDVTRLPSLTESKFPVSGTSCDIDARVKAILQEGLSVYRVDAEKLESAQTRYHRHPGPLRGLRRKPERRRGVAARVEWTAGGDRIA